MPSPYPLNGPEALLEDSRIKALLAAPLRGFTPARIFRNVGHHAPVENGLAVGPAVVDAVQTDGRALQVHADGVGQLGKSGQGVAQQRRFVAVARRAYEWRDDVAVPVAEGHDLVALEMLVTAVAEIVAAFFRRRRCAIAMNDRQIEQLVIIKPAHRAGKDGIHATVGLPAPHQPVDTRVLDFWTTFCIPFDR